jgi:hypothetical protein
VGRSPGSTGCVRTRRSEAITRSAVASCGTEIGYRPLKITSSRRRLPRRQAHLRRGRNRVPC